MRTASRNGIDESLVDAAAQLVNTITAQADADKRAFEQAYRLGFAAGAEVGYARAQQEEEQRAKAQAEAIDKFSKTRTYEELQAIRYPGYTPEQMRKLRGRDHFPVNDRLCVHCDGRGFIPGGAM